MGLYQGSQTAVRLPVGLWHTLRNSQVRGSKVDTRSFSYVAAALLTVGLASTDGSSIEPCTAEVLLDELDDLINIALF